MYAIPKAPRADSHCGFTEGEISDSIGVGSFAPCHQRSDCERTIRLRSFGRSPGARRTPTRAGGFCPWPRFGTGWTEARRRRSAAWTGRRCATGSIASTLSDRRVSSTIGRRVQASPVGGATGPVRADRRGRAGSREGRRGALAADRPQARHRREVRRRLSPRYVGKLLKKLGFSHMSARPRHPAQDERIVEGFKKTSRAR